jgi:AraC-like DNA-binding protein
MVHPIQPYFAFSTDKYYKRPFQVNGIAHMYEYTCRYNSDNTTTAIPDGCIDVIFDTTSEDAAARAAGTVLTGTRILMEQGHTYFGIRFEPGVMPVFLNGTFRELIEADINLSDCTKEKDLAKIIRELTSFRERADYFTLYYRNAIGITSTNKASCSANAALFSAIRNRIQARKGQLRIKELENFTGYSSRYIDKVFKDYAGMSPKTFAQIIRFQSTIDHLDHDNLIPLSDLAASGGYYDQPQFIRDFRKFTGTTPKEYRRRIIATDYMQKFIVT